MTTTKSDYSKKLLDPRWQKKRLEILSRDKFTCQMCGDKETTLHVHHKRYKSNTDPWDYQNFSLVTLCSTCHEEEKECMSECLSNITDLIKNNFLSNGVFTLSNCLVAILSQVEIYNRDVQLLIKSLDYLLSNDACVDEMIMDYEEYINGKAKENNG